MTDSGLPSWGGGGILNSPAGGAPGGDSNLTDTPLVQVLGRFDHLLDTDTTTAVGMSMVGDTDPMMTVTIPDDLPLFDAGHERRLLREPWASALRKVVSSPNPNVEKPMTRPCLSGQNCIALNPEIENHSECGGMPLCEIMTPEELEQFEDYGHYPSSRRLCVLCSRWNTHTAYLHLRTRKTKPMNALINWYINPIGSGGYRRECCIPLPNTSGWSGVMGTVVMLQLNRCRWVQDGITRQWRIDQSSAETQQDASSPERQLFRGGAEIASLSS